ncbi:hypothetical protein SMICM304S_00116 [Streptomyces microflavus]
MAGITGAGVLPCARPLVRGAPGEAGYSCETSDLASLRGLPEELGIYQTLGIHVAPLGKLYVPLTS